MKITHKLLLGFVSIALLTVILGDMFISSTQKALRKAIGQDFVTLSVETMDKIDMHIFMIAERLQIYSKSMAENKQLIKSNEKFERLNNIQQYIDKKNSVWAAAGNKKATNFKESLINNDLSEKLRKEVELKDFYKEKHGHSLFEEVILTNKYGVNIAQTRKTSDYYQADKWWWQEAKDNGLFIADVQYDEIQGICSIDICTRIDDDRGDFLGVMKSVLNLDEIIYVLKKSEKTAKFKSMRFKLLTKDGKLIYSTIDYEPLESLYRFMLSYFTKQHLSENVSYFVTRGDQAGKDKQLLAYAHSKGYRDFKGFGWTLVVVHDAKEVFAPVAELRSLMLDYSAAATLLATLVGLYISRSIYRPINKLYAAANEISEENLNTQIEIESNDEIGQLGETFNKMIHNLNKTTTSITKLNKEIVEHRQTEQQLREANEKLKELDRHKDEFSISVSHELRTPLAIFRNILSNALAGTMGKISPELRGSLTVATQGVDRLAKIVSDLLDISRINTGKLELYLERRSIQSIVNEAVKFLLPMSKAKGIELKGTMPQKELFVNVDHGRMIQVLTNLIANALKFTPEIGGRINVQVKDLVDEIGVSVEDNGRGIAAGDIDKVFDRFVQVEKQTGPGEHGTGLGLAIVKELMDMHGGRVWATSDGEGTSFCIVLPKYNNHTSTDPEVSEVSEPSEMKIG